MHDIANDIRMSDSPGRSPQVTTELGSPVRSVQADLMEPIQMESIHSQADFGHRTADFFDHNSSSDSLPVEYRDQQTLRGEANVTGAMDDDNDRHSRTFETSKQRRSGHYLGGTTEQFHSYCGPERRVPTPPSPRSPTDFEHFLRLTPGPPPGGFRDGYESGNSSLIESVEEMTPSRPTRRSRNNNDPMHLETPFMNPRSSPPTQEEESPILPKHNMADHIKEVHHITMQTLLESGSQGVPSDYSPRLLSDKTSKYLDHRNSRYRSSSAPIRKVTMAPPPPIDTTAASRNWPNQKVVATPYPFQQIQRNKKDFGRQFSASEAALRSSRANDSVLNLSIRRCNPNSRLRLTTLIIPANSEFSAAKGHNNNEKSYHAIQDFDDAELFRQLRGHYAQLLGPFRLFSARSLSCITVNGTASRTADSGYGWLVSPRSPRVLAYKGLNDTFSEANLLRFFKDPKAAGKRRYAWVSWAHRLADAPVSSTSSTPLPMPPSVFSQGDGTVDMRTGPSSPVPVHNRFSMIRRLEQHEGLEFVVSWSAKRILLALMMVVVLSVMAMLLWIFLGTSSAAVGGSAGFRNAGDRVVSGVVMGISVLLIGLTGIGGWIGVSWLVL